MSAHEASAHEASTHEASAHEAALQDASPHEAALQDASPQDASPQEASPHDALLLTVSFQLAELNARPPSASLTRNPFNALFGFGGVEVYDAALPPFSSPTPAEPNVVAPGTGLAVTINAPLIWSGVHDGCRANSCAAAPATTGAAK